MSVRNFPRELMLIFAACSCGAPHAGGPSDSTPARALIPAPPSERTAGAARHQPLTVDEPICDPGEIETCVCADSTTGGRRCNARGTAFDDCDACPDTSSCGKQTCSAVRIGLIGLTLPACCPERQPDQCGIDVSFVAKNYGLALGCLEFHAPGEPDSSCPSAEVSVPERGLVKFNGCRALSGDCGYDIHVPDVIDLGCVAAGR